MGYRDLVNEGASRTEIQSFLTQGDMTTTTVRIPANLKAAITEEATLSGVSFSAYMRQCAIQRLTSEAGDLK
jgi:hypothetical protein